MKQHDVIAMDGPAASGKSTVGRLLALELGYFFLDTGLTYRAATLACMNAGIDLSDAGTVVKQCDAARIELLWDEGKERVLLDGLDVTGRVTTPQVTANVRHVAGLEAVREKLVQRQREVARKWPVVAVGRDVCTVVFRSARHKFYLDASVEVRAGRRHKEMAARGEKADLSAQRKAIRERDEADAGRDVSPLRAAKDAEVIDTSEQTTEAVVALLLKKIRDRP